MPGGGVPTALEGDALRGREEHRERQGQRLAAAAHGEERVGGSGEQRAWLGLGLGLGLGLEFGLGLRVRVKVRA